MLELSDQKFRTIMIATLKVLMDKLDGMQEQMAMEAERWKPRERNEEMLEIKKKKNSNGNKDCH